MLDQDKTKRQLLEELEEMRRRVAADSIQRKLVEEGLRESEERYRLLAEAIPHPVWRSDADGKQIDCNRRWQEYTGQTPEDAQGNGWMKALHPDDVARAVQRARDDVAGGVIYEAEYRLHRASDDSYHWYLARAIPWRDASGKILGWFGSAMDIDAQKQAEAVLQKAHDELEQRVEERTAELAKVNENLRQSEERYELAVQGAGVGILDWDIRTNKLYYSPRWKMLFGYNENEIGESIEDLTGLLHPDERDRVLNFQNDFLEGTAFVSSNEFRLRHKDGSYRWIVAHALAVRDEQGRACRLVGSHGDITDRKLAEEALAKERQSLWRMLQASDHERQIISYEIHDGLAQYLAAAGMQFQAYETLRDNLPNEALKAYETAVELVRQAHAESRRLINEVRPPVIDEIGLETALSHLVHEQRRRGGPKIKFDSDVQFVETVADSGECPLPHRPGGFDQRLQAQQEQEGDGHPGSGGAGRTPGSAGLGDRIRYGIGKKGHFGLEGIRQRVRLLGGRLAIESRPDSGTLVQVVVPILEKQTEGLQT